MPDRDEATGRSLHLRIAGILIEVTAGDTGMRLQPGDLARFCVPGGTPDISIRAAWHDLSNYDYGEMVFDSGGAWQLFSSLGQYVVRCWSPSLGSVPYQVARFNGGFTEGEVLLHRPYYDAGAAVIPLQYPMDEVLMLQALARGRGAEIHACGVVDRDGNGLAFTGHSGAGKTTMARLWAQESGVAILSDDRIILRVSEGQYWMHGTPWHGEAEFAEPRSAPLRRLFFLRHASQNSLVRKSGVEAAAMLFARTFPTFHDREGLDFTLGFYQGLTEQVPCCDLGVVPDRRVIDFVRQACGSRTPDPRLSGEKFR